VYALRLGRGMSGRIAAGKTIRDVEAGARAPIALDDDARGRIRVGDALVLFHFVEPPVPQARPQLPLSVRRGTFDGLDWRTTCIAAFSFLFHFGAVGTAYADFADPVIDDDGARVAATVGVLKTIPSVPTTEVPGEERTNKDSASKVTEPAHPRANTNPSPSGATGGNAHPTGGGDRAMNSVRARAIADQLRCEGQAMLSVLGGGTGGATRRVLVDSDVPPGMLNSMAASGSGAVPGGPALIGSTGGGAVHPGARGWGGFDRPGETKRDTKDETGTSGGPKKPVPGTSIAQTETTVGSVPDAGRVIGGLRGMLRACYKHELDDNPEARGTVRVTVTINPGGDVRSVQTANSGLSSKMGACVSGVVHGAQFSPPVGGGSAVVSVPMTFIPQ
jgi:TonB family protein